MLERRMAYRIPEKKFKEVNEKLTEEGLNFEDFLDKTIDLYLSGQLDPKNETEEWGKWMEKKNS